MFFNYNAIFVVAVLLLLLLLTLEIYRLKNVARLWENVNAYQKHQVFVMALFSLSLSLSSRFPHHFSQHFIIVQIIKFIPVCYVVSFHNDACSTTTNHHTPHHHHTLPLAQSNLMAALERITTIRMNKKNNNEKIQKKK